MSEKKMMKAVVIRQEKLADGVFDLWIRTDEIADNAQPGQFITLYCEDKSRMLPRPISICEIDKENRALRIVYRIAGKGTEEFSKLGAEMTVEIIGPLGNGFPLINKKAFLIGGGIGIPPMLELAKQLDCEKQIILGYRDQQTFLAEDFSTQGSVYIATEDGSVGTKGTVLDAIRENQLTTEIIFACGPTPMLRAIKEFAAEQGIECYVSLEERMACGIGACLGCVCKSKEKDEHTNVNNKRICKEGPVFLAGEVDF